MSGSIECRAEEESLVVVERLARGSGELEEGKRVVNEVRQAN